jgi:hypothetical protein
MAIIRTQLVSGQRRIITKVVNGQRRVSCSCCPSDVECCMYPADQLGVGYAADDLPDKIKFVGGEFAKNNPPLEFTNDPNVLIYYGFAGEGVGISGGEGLWRQFVDFGGTDGARCLIGDIGGSSFTDNFADAYTADLVGRVVERKSLCVWEDGGFVLVYTTPESIDAFDVFGGYTGPLYKWVAQGKFLQPDEGGGFWVKDDPQNSPVGTYQGTSGQPAGLDTLIIS